LLVSQHGIPETHSMPTRLLRALGLGSGFPEQGMPALLGQRFPHLRHLAERGAFLLGPVPVRKLAALFGILPKLKQCNRHAAPPEGLKVVPLPAEGDYAARKSFSASTWLSRERRKPRHRERTEPQSDSQEPRMASSTDRTFGRFYDAGLLAETSRRQAAFFLFASACRAQRFNMECPFNGRARTYFLPRSQPLGGP
jgi:hypothetical protein